MKRSAYAEQLDEADFAGVVRVRAAAGLGVRVRDVHHAQLVARNHTALRAMQDKNNG